ncbi:MAG TPA: hypothetical protein GXX29_09670 [Firmicutes bacterium]|nr:hypothetical protein [Bacillota bacterium]
MIMLAMLGLQLPPLIRQKQRREMAAFLGMWFVAAVWGGLLFLDVPLPRPSVMITAFFEKLWQVVAKGVNI